MMAASAVLANLASLLSWHVQSRIIRIGQLHLDMSESWLLSPVVGYVALGAVMVDLVGWISARILGPVLKVCAPDVTPCPFGKGGEEIEISAFL